MRLPKLRELKEAIIAVSSTLSGRRFTTRFPAEPCVVPERYRGKPEFDLDTCIGCGACVNVCPTPNCLTMDDDLEADSPVRRITHRPYACIFCGNCQDNCTTETGVKLSDKWDLATLNKDETIETHEFELQMCEKCGAMIGAKKHLVWLYEKLGPLAYTNPSLLIAKSGELLTKPQDIQKQPDKQVQTSDFMRILCPKCKCELNIRL
ncbi:MAG: 4Fe-4S dicluster domain-containing protein [Planctomycetota bacterium]|jgi:formate hydrogenlyase subunit 6/NADH:ubiquinone oxidoreductase subunit I